MKTLVVAGNFGEFKEWQRTSRVKDGVYVSTVEKLYGYRPEGVDLILFGRWYMQYDIVECLIDRGFLVEEKKK
jgi:hypothetical protein